MILIILISLFSLATLFVFSSPKFSPIPYFPSNQKDMPLIIETLELRNNQIVIDFGAGDGAVVVAGATSAFTHHLNTQFIAVEINPYLLGILQIRRFFHPNRKNIHIVRFNMFKDPIDSLITLCSSKKEKKIVTSYFYISPRYLVPMKERLQKVLPKSTIVSYFYSISDMKAEKEKHGIHAVYRYKLI